MFGHQDDLSTQQDNHAATPEPQADATLSHDAPAITPAPSTLPSLAGDDAATTSAPAVIDDTAGDYIMTEPHTPATAPAPAASSSAPAATIQPTSAAPAPDDLLELKQGALQQLTPLLDHLDQTPEEKFRTTMMMIQAADNQSLLKTAYETAQKIEDENVRAQALLDVVNEINYFTQQNGDGDKAASEEDNQPD